jgi:dTDP-glucose pyrophosphorylase
MGMSDAFINIVIPMAGAGSRFSKAGYLLPKPLIELNGIPMIRLVIENLRPKFRHRFIFICQNSHIESYDLRERLSIWAPNSVTIGIDGLTEGAACTVLRASDLIDNEHHLMIANSDQYVDVDINDYLLSAFGQNVDGLIMTMHADNPKWSFVSLNSNGFVKRVVEKEVISNHATVGIYNFVKGRDFVSAANEMISNDLRVNNEFYVAPVYNQLINRGYNIGIFDIDSFSTGMYGLGTPEDFELFIKHPISQKATKIS